MGINNIEELDAMHIDVLRELGNIGSGNAATQAFNEAVTVHALDLGVNIVDMGSLATFAGSLGRCMSPVAGVCFVCAGLARVDPASLVKRTLLPSICALISVYLSLFVF